MRASVPLHGQTSPVAHDGSGVFEGLPSPLTVGRYHSLVVEPQSLPRELRATAWTADRVLMAFQHAQLPVFGVQFHPESILTQHGYALLANFLPYAGLEVQATASELAANELTHTPQQRRPLPARPVTF